MDVCLGPDERLGVLVVGLDESIDVLPELLDRGEGGTAQGLALEDREPNLDLVEPGGASRREVEVTVGMALEPAVDLGLVGTKVVEDDMDGGVSLRIGGGDLIHEIKKLDPPPALFVCGGARPSVRGVRRHGHASRRADDGAPPHEGFF